MPSKTDTREQREQYLLLLEEQAKRQQADPLRGWVPTAKQRPFIEAVLGDASYENWFLAANRSGKSDAGAKCGAQLARFGVPGQPFRPMSGWVASMDFPGSRDIMQPKYFDNGVGVARTHPPFIPDREILEWRVTDQILKLRNGSLIGFKSYDSGVTKFRGAEKDWIHFDEEPPKEIYEECVIRVAAGSRLRMFGTCTLLPPEGVAGGVSWLYPVKVVPWAEGRAAWGIFTSSIYDNPHLDAAEMVRLEAIYPEGTLNRRIRLNGELLPGLTGARAYPAFERRLHVRPQPEPNAHLPLCWWWDFNVEPLMSGVGQRQGSLFRVFRVFTLEEGNILGMVDLFREAYPRHRAEIWIYGDATGRRRTAQTTQSDYQLILNAMRTYPTPTRLKVPEDNPPTRERVNAVNYALMNEHGQISVEIDPACRELLDDFEQVLDDGRGGVKKVSNRTTPYFRRTHISDALGYWIHKEAPVATQQEPVPTYQAEMPTPKNPGYGFTHAKGPS